MCTTEEAVIIDRWCIIVRCMCTITVFTTTAIKKQRKRLRGISGAVLNKEN